MGIFKPSRVNKREYPGNANVIGPTTVPSFSESTHIVVLRQMSLDLVLVLNLF